jgi:hypothetical protein
VFAVPDWFSAVAAPCGRLRGSVGFPRDPAPLSCGAPCDHCVEKSGDDALLALGELGDGIELLFEFGHWPLACAARGGWRKARCFIVSNQGFDGNTERLGETGEHGDGNAALADFVEGKLRLRDTQRVGKLHLRQIGGGAGFGDALAEALEIGLFVGTHGGLCDLCGEAMHERNTCFCG